MPYNTRRKSLSLPSLGIHIPVTQAERSASSSSKASRRSSSSASNSGLLSSASHPDTTDSHPSKRLKRAHGSLLAPTEAVVEHTPPPSPTTAKNSIEMTDAPVMPKIDLEGINDDIVEASIAQLQSTANRPHLIKELETVLSQKLTSVQQYVHLLRVCPLCTCMSIYAD